MKTVAQLRHALAELPDDTPIQDALAWINAADTTQPQEKRTLPFLEAGKAFRIVLPIMGKPYSAANTDMSGRNHWPYRLCIWQGVECTTEKKRAACNALSLAGLDAYWLTDSGKFQFRIGRNTYPSAFYTSDDPAVWEQRQRREEEKAAHRAEMKQRRAEFRRSREAERNAQYWAESRQREEQRKAEQAEKERLLQLAKDVEAQRKNNEQLLIVEARQRILSIHEGE